MLIQLTKAICINDSYIVQMATHQTEGKTWTSVYIRGRFEPIMVPGDWVKKIVGAKQLGAIYLTSTHHTLRG